MIGGNPRTARHIAGVGTGVPEIGRNEVKAVGSACLPALPGRHVTSREGHRQESLRNSPSATMRSAEADHMGNAGSDMGGLLYGDAEKSVLGNTPPIR